MTRVVLAGTALALAAGAIVLLSTTLGTEVQGVALLGAALGGVLGLVPDRSPLARVGGFLVGLAAAGLGYVARAALLPDARSGRAVAVVLVVLACVAVTAATRRRVALWSMLLGAGALAGAYEATYAADPSNILTTVPAAATAVLLTSAAGFLATALLAPVARTGLADDELSPAERAEREAFEAREAREIHDAHRGRPDAQPSGVAALLPLDSREA